MRCTAGEKLVVYRTKGYAVGRITQLLSHTQLALRSIVLTRPGESVSSSLGKLGGLSGLTVQGSLYAQRFAQVLAGLLANETTDSGTGSSTGSCGSNSFSSSSSSGDSDSGDSGSVSSTTDSLAECAVWAAASPAASEFVAPLASLGVEILQLAALNDIAYG
jgi:hypothetical protein